MKRSPRRDARATEDAILALGTEIYQLTKAAIGNRIGRNEATVANAMRRLDIDHDGAAISRVTIRHGTPGAWQTKRCRCQVCDHARREYKRAERARRLDRFNPDRYEHGLMATYQAGCNCDDCAEVMRLFLAERNESSRKTAQKHGGRWTGPEVEHALRDDLPLEEIARDLGRTYAAVSNVRKAVARGDHQYLVLLGQN